MPPKKKRPYKPLTPRQQLQAKKRRLRHKALHPFAVPRVASLQTLLRKAYQDAGAGEVFRYKRLHGTDVERLLQSQGLPPGLSKFLSARDQLVERAALTGLKPGRTALTLPERLTIQWLESNSYTFGGVYPNITMGADFYSQYPLGGGRSRGGGGLVADIFISDIASHTAKGVVLAVDGNYWHSKVAVSGRDAAQNVLVQSEGYVVARITDTQIYQPGTLDSFMRNLLGTR